MNRRRGLLVVVAAGWVFLGLAWVVGNPSFAAPDEWAHYARSLGISDGSLIGKRAAIVVPDDGTEAADKRQLWVADATRDVHVPDNMFAPELDCNAAKRLRSAACLDQIVPGPEKVVATPVGNYQPLAYVAPALTVRLGWDPVTGAFAGRLANALVCLGLLLVAFRFLVPRDGSVVPALGVILAVTPMVVFMSASINPSASETTASAAFAAGCLRLARGPDLSRLGWLTLGVVGAYLALSRSPAPVWVALSALLLVGLVGFTGLWSRVRQGGRWAWFALVLVAAGGLANRWWEQQYGSHIRTSWPEFRDALGPAWERFPQIAREEVGIFGTLDTALPRGTPELWWALVLVLCLVAFVVSTKRERIVLAVGALVGLVLVPVLLSALLVSGTGFDAQGRHVLPAYVIVVLLAAELVHRNRDRLNPGTLRVLALVVCSGTAAVQGVAWYWNARRQAVGSRAPLDFISSAEWSPPLGWWTWLVVMLLGIGLMVVPALIAWRDGRDSTEPEVTAPA